MGVWRITLRASALRWAWRGYAGLSAVAGGGGDVFFYGESAGAAAGYAGAACGCVARGGAGDTAGATVSSLRVQFPAPWCEGWR